MKIKTILFFTTLFLFACETKNKSTLEESKSTESVASENQQDKIVENPQSVITEKNWQEGFGLTHDIDQDSIWKKPVRYYIENKNCSPIAIDFYFGRYRPIDIQKTEDLLSLVTTDDAALRPFYRWILNKTIQIQDGALGEYTGKPARQYAEKFPNEFFEYMDIEKTNDKYLNWTNAILYSGFYIGDDYDKPNVVRKDMIKNMSDNCKQCTPAMLLRIKKLALDCFPDAEKE